MIYHLKGGNVAKSTMYQTGTINSLLEAVYYGDTSIAELKEHGDFGLGTFDLVDGELIVCDNQYYRADVNGKLSIAEDAIKSPFAVVNTFISETKIAVHGHDFTSLAQLLELHMPSKNLIYAVKINGHFKSIDMRSEKCQSRPFRPLSESLPQLQNAFVKHDITGIIVGVWFPTYLQQLNIPGFHFHFIDHDRKVGGHVFNFELTDGSAEIQTLKSLQVDLIDNEAFFNANLNSTVDESIAKVEKH